MSRFTSRVRVLAVEEFETRAVPAVLGLSLPTAALSNLDGVTGTLPHGLLRAIDNGAPGLLRAIENGAPGLVGRIPTPDAVTPPVLGQERGGVVTPTVPTAPVIPTTPVAETPGTSPVDTPAGTGEPVAGPIASTPTTPTTPTTAAGETPAATPLTADNQPSAAAATATVSPAFAADGVATTTPAAFSPTTPAGVTAGGTVEAAPSRTTALAAATGVFQSETPPAALVAAPGPVLMGIPVDPATAAVTPLEVLPPPVEVAPAAQATDLPAVEAPAAAATAVPDAVAAPAAGLEEGGMSYWTWASVLAAVAAGGYWAARRYQLVRRLAAYLRTPALPVRA